jgi:hypothetical protein
MAEITDRNLAETGGDQRAAARRRIRALDQALNEIWNLGRNIVVGWSPAEDGMRLLAIPQYMLPELSDDQVKLLSGGRMMAPDRVDEVARRLGVRPLAVSLPFSPGRDGMPIQAVDSVVRRYSITKSEHRAAVLFDIVGFSLYSPLEQVTLLNSLSYSINVGHSRALANGLRIDLGRSTTGDGFYVWNRDDGVEADINLFYLMMLTLADNALARRKGAPCTAPVLRTCFHVGSHYEYYQAEGLNPAINGFIVGDLTIELARMINKALPGQLLIGSFTRPRADGNGRASPLGRIATPMFVERAQSRLDRLNEVVLSGERISSIKCYLTGQRIGPGVFTVKKFSISDKHGRRRDVFNAKVNIYRGNADALYLGIEHRDLERFDAEPSDYLPSERFVAI